MGQTGHAKFIRLVQNKIERKQLFKDTLKLLKAISKFQEWERSVVIYVKSYH